MSSAAPLRGALAICPNVHFTINIAAVVLPMWRNLGYDENAAHRLPRAGRRQFSHVWGMSHMRARLLYRRIAASYPCQTGTPRCLIASPGFRVSFLVF